MIKFEKGLTPRLFRIRKKERSEFLENPEKEIENKMKPFLARIKPRDRIGIAAGSRGIFNYARMIKKIAEIVKEVGGQPFIIPAMGSHGGATAEGQRAVLKGYNITEESVGAPILSSMETVVAGYAFDNIPVYFDKNANDMDGVIMVNRVKPHTDFHSEIESGLMKQIAIGLGKQKGASTIHRQGVYGLKTVMPEAARIIMKNKNILMGVAIIENEEDKTAIIEVLPVEDIEKCELKLLVEAKKRMPSIPFENLDVLVLEEMGKNISGTGIDPNIVGRYLIRNVEDKNPNIYRIVCLNLTDESHHNAIGVGIADIITRKMYEKIDLEPTYVNTITSGFLERGFIPVIAENDKSAIEIALNCCNKSITKENARMVIIKNTLDLNEMIVSERLLDEIREHHNYDILEEVILQWDAEEYLVDSLFAN